MSEKLGTVQIIVTGRPKSGKSTIMNQVARHLKTLGFEVELRWGIDGEPKPKFYNSKDAQVRNVSDRTKVVITETQLTRAERL